MYPNKNVSNIFNILIDYHFNFKLKLFKIDAYRFLGLIHRFGGCFSKLQICNIDFCILSVTIFNIKKGCILH